MSSHPNPSGQSSSADGYSSGEGGYGAGYGGYGSGYDGYGSGYDGYGQGHRPEVYGQGEPYGAPYQPAAPTNGGFGSGYGQAGSGQAGYYPAPEPDPSYAEQTGYAQQPYGQYQSQQQPYGQYTPPADHMGYTDYADDLDPVYVEAPASAPAAPAPAAATLTAERAPAARPEARGGSRAVSRTGTRTQVRAAAKARARRKRRVRNGFLGVGSVAAVAVIAVAGFLHPEPTRAAANAAASPTVDSGRSSSAPADASRSVTRPTPTTALKQLPGLGASFRAKVPANAQQVLLVTGTGKNANTSTAVLYTRTADGSWLPGTSWAAHNAKDGWTADHMAGDLHSPIGVYSLTDAGGLDANPGTKLPYLHSSAFKALGTGFEGESLADAFDYVVAINYNHDPGTSPLSADRPMGASRGGGIWIHVDHGGPTHGCISLSKANMAILLRDLDPSKHPVIVMGDAASLRA